MIIAVLPAFVVTGLLSLENGCTGGEPCGMFHVNLHEDRMYFHCSNFSLDTSSSITITIEASRFQSRAFIFGCAKSQNLARLREIAKINTRKTVGTLKSQNFVLANNSNNKVKCKGQGIAPGVAQQGQERKARNERHSPLH